ncbi:hypothetical protein PoB_000451400 [Plakobranchus ocellatus]|uniref:Secreted protein n=1 Tax=Plakobranchus ocellatus TaxID=259542 RepID=A0AAV3Y7F3_9GAST|nr:hypothetical protein PoB_000451400 [Plakobranchus ocellatus]
MRLRGLQAMVTLLAISRMVSLMLMTGHAKCEPFSLPTVLCWDEHIRIDEQQRTWTYFLQRSRMRPITMLQERLMAQDRVGFRASMLEVSSVEKTCKLRKR